MIRRLTICFLCLLTLTTASMTAAVRTSKQVKKEKTAMSSKIKQTDKKLKEKNVKTQQMLRELNALSTDIAQHTENIRVTQNQVNQLDNRINVIGDSIANMEKQIDRMRKSYAAAVRKIKLNQRGSMSMIAYVLSAESFTKAYRRMRYIHEFAKWREKKSNEITESIGRLNAMRGTMVEVVTQKNNSLVSLSANQTALESKKKQVEVKMATLKKEGNALQEQLDAQRKLEQKLDGELSRIIAAEKAAAEKAKAEAKAKAKAEAAAKAKAKAEAEAAARAKAKAEAEAAARAKAKAEADAKKATAEASKKAENKGKTETAEKVVAVDNTKKVVTPEPPKEETPKLIASTTKTEELSPLESLTARFEANRGRMLFPVTGQYEIRRHFGQSGSGTLAGTSHSLDIESKGGQARVVFDGSVSAVYEEPGALTCVIIRHGTYLTFYTNIKSTSLRHGMKVKAGQIIGPIGQNPQYNDQTVVKFRMVKENPGGGARNFKYIDPEQWVRR